MCRKRLLRRLRAQGLDGGNALCHRARQPVRQIGHRLLARSQDLDNAFHAVMVAKRLRRSSPATSLLSPRIWPCGIDPRRHRKPVATQHALRYIACMRTIGRERLTISALPSADGLHRAAQQQAIASVFDARATTGIPKGVYRFRSQDDADRQRFEALVRVVSANAHRQRSGR